MPDNPRTTPGVTAALTIAGSDPSGGAGIQADLKTFSALRVFGCAALTALTAQNTTGVKAVLALDPPFIEQQIDAVAGDILIKATKTGMLSSAPIISTVASAIARHNLYPYVCDPVMVSRSGDSLIDESAVKVLTKKLLPMCAVVTPNRHEAVRLLGIKGEIDDVGSATQAARDICGRLGARACVVKGIRRTRDSVDECVDLFYDGKEAHEIVAAWRDTKNTHGSGCTFSAAITAALALGQELHTAVQTARNVVSEALRQTTDLGLGRGPVNHLAYLDVKG